MAMLDELGRDARYPSNALKRVGAAIDPESAAARNHLAETLPALKLERLARRLRRAVKHIESTVPSQRHKATRPARAWTWAVDARASRRAADVRAAIEIAGSVYAPERLHDVRIAVKRLRYALELRAEAGNQRGTRDLTALKTAQGVLGRLHDVEMLIARTRQAQASLSPPTPQAWRELGTLGDLLEDHCRVLHARYMRNRANLTAIADRVQANNTSTTFHRRAVS
jgi:CHAD domain-containing protein